MRKLPSFLKSAGARLIVRRASGISPRHPDRASASGELARSTSGTTWMPGIEDGGVDPVLVLDPELVEGRPLITACPEQSRNGIRQPHDDRLRVGVP